MKESKIISNKNPNFIFCEEIKGLLHSDQYEIDNAFDIYSLLEDENKIYLAGSTPFCPKNLSIYLFQKNFIHLLTLIEHSDFVSNCKYFRKLSNKKEYLISSSYSVFKPNEIIIWSIINFNNYIQTIKIKLKNEIERRIKYLLIENNNEDYLIYTSSNYLSCLLKLKEKKVLKKINSKNNILNYYIWKNNKDKQNYIIQFNIDSITIFCAFLEKDLFDEIKIDELKGDNNSGCIIYNKNNTDIICILNEKGNFIFYDLYNFISINI